MTKKDEGEGSPITGTEAPDPKVEQHAREAQAKAAGEVADEKEDDPDGA